MTAAERSAAAFSSERKKNTEKSPDLRKKRFSNMKNTEKNVECVFFWQDST